MNSRFEDHHQVGGVNFGEIVKPIMQENEKQQSAKKFYCRYTDREIQKMEA